MTKSGASPILVLGLVLCLLATVPAGASEAENLKADAMRGDTEAIMRLTEAYFHGTTVQGIPKDLRRSFVWGTAYMELVPDYGRGVERVTIFSEQELFAEGMSESEHAALVREAKQLAGKIRNNGR